MYEIFEKLCDSNSVTPYRVSKETGVPTATLTAWKQGKYTPKEDKLQLIADYFGVTVEYLRTGEIKEGYYLDKTAAATMQMLFDSPGKKALFDAMETMTDEEAKAYADLHRRITNGNNESN